MDTLFLYNTKTLKEKFKTKVFAGDNHITKINVQIPDNIGGYPKSECEYNLRAIIPEGNLSYMINPSQPYFYITNDITEKAQTVKLMMIITHEGNVIGRTNTVDLIVNEPAEAPDPPLTPREEFDEVIAEQRAKIAEQAETISEQATAIEAKDGQISELNDEITEKDGQITELNTENTRLENLTDTQRETIQYMIDNPPALDYPENPVIPTRQAQTIRPNPPFYGIGRLEIDGYTPNNQNKTVTPSMTEQTVTAGENYDGLGVVTVEPVPLETKTVTPANAEITYTPTAPNIGFSSVTVEGVDIPLGGIYFTELDENNKPVGFKIVNYDFNNTDFSLPAVSRADVETIIFQNCQKCKIAESYFSSATKLRTAMLDGVTQTGTNSFFNCINLIEVTLFDGISVLGINTFYGCQKLSTINIPASLTSIMAQAFLNCTALQNVTIENGFNCNNLNLSSSTRFTAETIVSWLNALADRTGQTAYTFYVGTPNLNKLTAEQRAIATSKNWNLA